MNILDPRFKYTSAAHTDLRKTFARIRKEMAAKQEAERAAASKVSPLKRKAG